MTGLLRSWAARAVETLDDPRTEDAVIVTSLRDIARINRVFGGARAAVGRLDEFLARCSRGATLTLLDVGTGTGDIPRAAARRAQARGITLKLIFPATFDLFGSPNELIHAGQLIDIAAVPCSRCAETSDALKLA